MHDFFEILGLPTNARARDVRRACARRPRRRHPDFHETGAVGFDSQRPVLLTGRATDDAAIDFVDASTFTDQIQEQFFKVVG